LTPAEIGYGGSGADLSEKKEKSAARRKDSVQKGPEVVAQAGEEAWLFPEVIYRRREASCQPWVMSQIFTSPWSKPPLAAAASCRPSD
jgi:hypothetical protein